LGEFKCGWSSGIDVDFELNSVFVFLDDFYKNVSSLKLDVKGGLKTKSE
jgi:hypothetical protein